MTAYDLFRPNSTSGGAPEFTHELCSIGRRLAPAVGLEPTTKRATVKTA